MKNLITYTALLLFLSGCTIWQHPTLTRKAHADLDLAGTEQLLHGHKQVTLQGYYADGSSVLFQPDWRITSDSTIYGSVSFLNALGKPSSQTYETRELSIEGIELWRTSRRLNSKERAVFGGTILMASVDI